MRSATDSTCSLTEVIPAIESSTAFFPARLVSAAPFATSATAFARWAA